MQDPQRKSISGDQDFLSQAQHGEEHPAEGFKNEKDISEINDVEETATRNAPDLQRQISGPPYSIFEPAMKMWIIFLVSVSAIISPFAATTYYPALNLISDVMHVTPTLTNISVTTYMVRLGASIHST
jgi:hypothetical protein